jgi:O-antigen/teichoic acid export membrane protein
LITVPLGVFAVIYAREIVLVALGEQWIGSVVFLRIFGVIAAILPALASSGTVLITCGHSGRFLVVSVVNSALVAGLMLLCIPWGAIGIAGARAAALILIAPWVLHYSFRDTPVSVRDFTRSYLKPSAAAGIMAVVLLGVRQLGPLDSAPISLALGIVLSGAAYLVALSALPGGTAQLRSLYRELSQAIRRRSSRKVEPTKDTL